MKKKSERISTWSNEVQVYNSNEKKDEFCDENNPFESFHFNSLKKDINDSKTKPFLNKSSIHFSEVNTNFSLFKLESKLSLNNYLKQKN